jgi:hypothetical protein
MHFAGKMFGSSTHFLCAEGDHFCYVCFGQGFGDASPTPSSMYAEHCNVASHEPASLVVPVEL